MNNTSKLSFIIIISFLVSCSGNKLEEKGFSINPSSTANEEAGMNDLHGDSLNLETRPSSVLLTGHSDYRLTTIFKVNYNKKTKKKYIGSNDFHNSYRDYNDNDGNNWNYNYMPGLEAVYGYNMVNISVFNLKTLEQKNLFKNPVLIKTLYYPAFSKDTLNYEPVKRNYYMVTAYDEDTNGDSLINVRDLRRLYLFDIDANVQSPLVPKNYSVFKSQYDEANDYMYIFAKQDENKNGRIEQDEKTHIFWIDLDNPHSTGIQYQY